MGRQDADQREGNDRHHDERRGVVLEPADHQHVDQDEHGAKGQAEVAKDLDRHLPLAVPFHRGFRRVGRHDGVVDLHCGLRAAEVAAVKLREGAVHLEDGVDRALDQASDVGGDIGDVLEVLVVDIPLADGRLDRHEFAQ